MLLSKATYIQCIQAIHLYRQYVCSLGIEPTTFALLTQCSNHWATGTHLPSLPSPWKPTRITCTSSSRAGRAHLRLVTAGLDKPPQHTHWWDMSPEDSMLTLNLHCIPESSVWPASPPHTSTARRTATGKHDHGTEDSHWRARAQVFRGAPITNPWQREVYIPETLNKLTLRGIYWLPLVVWFFTPLLYIYIYIYIYIQYSCI